jgi:hypothetical protein
VPSFDVLEPLGPDACRSDPSAPCYYLHLKRRALNGERDKLSERELAFVGVGGPLNTPGWRAVESFPVLRAFELDDSGAAPVDRLFAALLAVGSSQERLEFLG